jgi:hypothetical protein
LKNNISGEGIPYGSFSDWWDNPYILPSHLKKDTGNMGQVFPMACDHFVTTILKNNM